MPTPEIVERMRQLRAQLTEIQLPEADPVASHIDSVLADPAHAPHYEGLSDRLRSASASIESRHPQLAASMNTVINALTATGL